MSKFDTHGGYFAPKDYMRVNEGGSHEENPNGGVQVGVDPEGTPNLLEEGEPVYKDYVYSDNIEAEKEFLEQNHLPAKYAGKLYSKIADDLFSEAEERPLDAISRNSLEVLLGRLADAQEGQKQASEQRELENELANLSPEELDQLEAMLAQEQPMEGTDAGAVGLSGPEGPEGESGPAEPTWQLPYVTTPMMANGGFLRTFETGGPKKGVADEIASEILAQAKARGRASGIGNTDLPLVDEHPGLDVALMTAQPGTILERAVAPSAYRGIINGIANGEDSIQLFAPFAKTGKGVKTALSSSDILNMQGKISEAEARIAGYTDELAKANETLADIKKGGPGSKDVVKKNISDLKGKIKLETEQASRIRKQLCSNGNTPSSTPKDAVDNTAKSEKKKSKLGWIIGGLAVPPIAGVTARAITGWRDMNREIEDAKVEGATRDTIGVGKNFDFGFLDEYENQDYASGGRINRFDGGGWADFLNRLAAYEYSKNPANVAGKYAIDRRYDVWGGRNARQIESDKAYQDFTNYVLANSDNPDVRNYLHALDRGVADGTPLLFDGENLASGWDKLYADRRRDGKLGIYHINPEDIGFLTAPAESVAAAQGPQNTGIQYELFPGQLAALQYGMQMDNLSPRMRYAMLYNGNDASKNGNVQDVGPDGKITYKGGDITPSVFAPRNEFDSNLLPTWPRYAGAVGSGLLGLYNAFQSPDKYTATRINPVLPEGRINLQNQVYNPIDQNMIANAQIAQGNATNRSLRNSGLGPSAGAAILATDNNLTGNLGTGFIQAWDANNQRRNAVVAANNQAEAQRAQFDYTVDAARKEAINRFAPYNAQNDLMIQRLNNQAEADKYTAISNQISNGLQALSGIGQENFAMNQINTNPAFLGYRVGPNGVQYYFNPSTGQYEPVKKS